MDLILIISNHEFDLARILSNQESSLRCTKSMPQAFFQDFHIKRCQLTFDHTQIPSHICFTWRSSPGLPAMDKVCQGWQVAIGTSQPQQDQPMLTSRVHIKARQTFEIFWKFQQEAQLSKGARLFGLRSSSACTKMVSPF